MHNQVVVIGIGRFGSTVARSLYQLDHQVLAIDRDEQAVQGVSPFVTEAVQANSMDEATLRDLGVNNFDVALVTIGTDVPTSIMTTVLLKNLEPVIRDLRIFSDKVARHPELLGVGGVLKGSAGVKEVPRSAQSPTRPKR